MKSPGTTITKSGYLRYTSPPPLRNRYVHRVIVENNVLSSPPEVRDLLPWPYEVHHMDYNKLNNDPSNLLMMSEAFHSALTAKGRDRCNRGRFTPKWSCVPEWALERESPSDPPREEGEW